MKKYILFDFDGTVADTGEGITNSVSYALKKMGIEPGEKEKLKRFVGPPLKTAFETFYDLTPEEGDLAVQYYREHYRESGMFECFIYEGITDVVEMITSSGGNAVIASSKPQAFVKSILEHFSILDRFAFVSGSEFDGRRVDKAEVIAYALTELGASAKDAVMVGDRNLDIIGAKKNGMVSVGVTYGYGSREELSAAGADHIVDTPKELRDLLESI